VPSFVSLAFALTCETESTRLELVTPDTVPPNAHLVVGMDGPVVATMLRDADGDTVAATVVEEAGHVVIIPDQLLAVGAYTLHVADIASFAITVAGEPDHTPPAMPTVHEAVHHVGSDTWGYAVDEWLVRVGDVPAGSHVELELTSPDGTVLLADTDERSIELGRDACEGYDWPRGYRGDATLRVRCVDAAGNPSTWLDVPVSITGDPTPQTGCSTARTPVVWGWLSRR
jgi:hypothetical protein